MDPEAAARVIVAWVEKRYEKVFWYCKWCVRSGFAFREHHGRISNYGVCETCHNQEDQEEMDYECDMRPSKEFHAMRELRWVGPRMERERERVSALMEKRTHDE